LIGMNGGSYWLGRLVITRAVGVVYLVAFVAVLRQFRALLGSHGLLPVPEFLRRTRYRDAPSLFHLWYSDGLVTASAVGGCALSVAILAGLVDRLPLWAWPLPWLVVWALYQSIVNVGQAFYSFGWESLLLEVGVLVAFLGPPRLVPPLPVLFLLRWLLFRLEFGAGLIKLRGDPCWRDLTCLYYHHETQPMPNPLSWYFHHLPKPLHKVEVAANHFAQLVVPFALFAPQPVATVAGAIIVVTQSWLLVSGNFSWLNALTIVLGFSAISDAYLHHALPLAHPHLAALPPGYVGVVIVLTAAVVVLSYWPVHNMVSRRQLMNFSFNRFHFVNTYGAFGSITRIRHEVVIEGTNDDAIGPSTEWSEYEFKGKPGDPGRRPPQVAPYHLRLDWLMWFAALSPSYAYGWFEALMEKLLEGDAATLRLLRGNPFPDAPPRWVRARLYRYRFTSREVRRSTGAWWDRVLVGEFARPMRLRTPVG
jgi:hypothetical protein